MACDPYTLTCTYKTGCGSGRIRDENGICLVDNGYPCPAVELQCIPGASCKNFGAGRHCHCDNSKFGEQCRFESPTFFGALLQSRISGFVGFHFVNLQELVNNVLAPVERLMTGGLLYPCDPNADVFAMKIVRYLGNVRIVNLNEMDAVYGAAQALVGKDELLCDYRKFLRCTVSGICEPMIGDVAIYEAQEAPEVPGGVKVTLSLKPRARCSGPGNFSNIPAIYQDVIHVQCLSYQVCKSVQGKITPDKFCLCPDGYQGTDCSERIPQAVQYASAPTLKTIVFGKIQKTKRIGRCVPSDGRRCFSHI
ncbi:unnamed protein product [Orchesella dallaii]|uniref:EGF-like domain-containing protein n=1 Tax=Orchesella dallaii TaxID=48710 RepID=A0ABP1PVH7_9HEXA